MTRRHGRAQRGQRLVAKAPYGRWRTLTFLAALRVDRIDAPLVLDGPINGRAFTAYVEQFLVPTLAPGDIVIMDNLRFPQGKGRTPRHPRRRRQTAVPTALLARLEPHRAGLLQAQDPDAKGRRTNRRGHLATRRQAARPVHRPRMRQLHQQRRICFNLKQSRSRMVAVAGHQGTGCCVGSKITHQLGQQVHQSGFAIGTITKQHEQALLVCSLPIRLTPMTATCRVPPLSRVKLGIGWSRGVARDAEQ